MRTSFELDFWMTGRAAWKKKTHEVIRFFRDKILLQTEHHELTMMNEQQLQCRKYGSQPPSYEFRLE